MERIIHPTKTTPGKHKIKIDDPIKGVVVRMDEQEINITIKSYNKKRLIKIFNHLLERANKGELEYRKIKK